jgi:hypothetical protein
MQSDEAVGAKALSARKIYKLQSNVRLIKTDWIGIFHQHYDAANEQ